MLDIRLLICVAVLVTQNIAIPQYASLVTSSTEPSNVEAKDTKEGDSTLLPFPKIYEMRVNSNVSNRFAHTVITSKVKNFNENAQEATFSVVLPETAYISEFVMEIGGKKYKAYVKEKEEAKRDYEQAVSSGLGAAHVAVSARDSNRFTVSVNVEPQSKAIFYLTYEQLLQRKDGHYELVINLHPGQPVKELNVEVTINESRALKDVKAPPIRSGNEIGADKSELDPRADINLINGTSAVIKFSPNLERQKQLAHILGTDENKGLSGQFVIQYDVERDPSGGEVLLKDGYFVHFFAPSDLQPLPKHVIFVLDTSGSMYNRKIEQLKAAMLSILDELKEKDTFHLVEFNTKVKTWNIYNPEASIEYPTEYSGWSYGVSNQSIIDLVLPEAYGTNPDNIKKTKDIISKLEPNGGTNIFDALRIALRLVELTKLSNKSSEYSQPLIVFLTDGEPTVGLSGTEDIVSKITELNSGVRSTPLFTLSFGDGADKQFLRKLSLRNSGFSKHIYEASDAALQLEGFYRTISSPLISNVTFTYIDAIKTTTSNFPILFGGSELVVAGIIDKEFPENPSVHGYCATGLINLVPKVIQPVSELERLWAYLTVQQLLEQLEIGENKTQLKNKALDLALKYSFVTSVSSLVVVKPNATDAVNTENAEGGKRTGFSHRSFITSVAGHSGYNYHSAKIQPLIVGGLIDFRVSSMEPVYYEPLLPLPTDILETSSAASTTTTTKATKHQHKIILKLLSALPWLQNLLNNNGSITIPLGSYKLGTDVNLNESILCNNADTPSGKCMLLHKCPQLFEKLRTVEIFVKHFCSLEDQYAGVCCPN